MIMETLLHRYSSEALKGYVGPAEVVRVNAEQNLILVRCQNREDRPCQWSRNALPQAQGLVAGDEVFVVSDERHDLYATAVLHSSSGFGKRSTQARSAVYAHNGAQAAQESLPDGERLRIFSKRGERVFEYDPEAETSTVFASGDLAFQAKDGDIIFSSDRAVRFHGESVELCGEASLRLFLGKIAGKLSPFVGLTPKRLTVQSDELDIVGQQSRMFIADAEFSGSRCKLICSQLIIQANKMRTVVKTMIERAENAYRSVTSLSQLQAGKLRYLVENLSYFKAKRTIMKSEKDHKVKADKIHLG